ncbi:MAG: hypothetical protein PVH05_10465 [Burkholderiales bacterium]|jgi:uncharacterized membrane protein
MTRSIRVLLVLCLLAIASTVLAHGTESHEDEGEKSAQGVSSGEAADAGHPDEVASPQSDSSEHEHGTESAIDFGEIIDDLTWSDFPTLHPMIVHVPVTLIPMAFVLAFVGLFVAQRIFLWLALAFAAIGLAGGFIAAFPTHPHTHGLSQAAELTLEKHDFFAYTTLWLTSLAVLVAAICIWRPARLSRIGLSLVLLLASLSVALTGHYGGTLAYVHGIGSQGRFLSAH